MFFLFFSFSRIPGSSVYPESWIARPSRVCCRPCVVFLCGGVACRAASQDVVAVVAGGILMSGIGIAAALLFNSRRR